MKNKLKTQDYENEANATEVVLSIQVSAHLSSLPQLGNVYAAGERNKGVGDLR